MAVVSGDETGRQGLSHLLLIVLKVVRAAMNTTSLKATHPWSKLGKLDK